MPTLHLLNLHALEFPKAAEVLAKHLLTSLMAADKGYLSTLACQTDLAILNSIEAEDRSKLEEDLALTHCPA